MSKLGVYYSNSELIIFSMSKDAVYLRYIRLTDYKAFKGENIFDLYYSNDKEKICQCTVILGNNGTGKTNLLKAIANLEPEIDEIKSVDSDQSDMNNPNNIENLFFDLSTKIGDTQLSPDFTHAVKYKPKVIDRFNEDLKYKVECGFSEIKVKKSNLNYSISKVLCRHETKIPQPDGSILKASSHAQLGYTANVNFVEAIPKLDNIKIDAYGTNRHAQIGSKRIQSELNSDSLFYGDNRIIDIESWILQLDIARKHNQPGASKKFSRLRNLIRHSSLFPDVKDVEIGFDKNLNSHVLFVTDAGKFRLNQLGYGYQCMFSWIFDFCKKMFDRYPDSGNPLKEPAILLIDEIDMHLHPKWQRSIIRDLCEMFPFTQIIVTTHSPLVIQSLGKINLFVLSNNSEKINIKHYPNKTFQGWTVEEIMSDLMELDEKVRSDQYLTLIFKLQQAMNNQNAENANKTFSELEEILHPNSIDREIIPMQIQGIKDND